MDNLSGTANWNGMGENPDKKPLYSSKDDINTNPIEVQKEIRELVGLKVFLQHYYNTHPNKHLHDAMISIEATIKSLQKI